MQRLEQAKKIDSQTLQAKTRLG